MTTDSNIFHLDDYTRLQQNDNNGYILPEIVLSAIRLLCSEIGYDESTTKDTYINQHNSQVENVTNTQSKSFKPKEREYRDHAAKQKQDTWKTKSDFKATKFAVLDGSQEIINNIRILMNKINESNRVAKIAEIVVKIQELIEESSPDDLDENMNNVFNIIYDIIMSSSMMPEIHANIISALYTEYRETFYGHLVKKIGKYIESFPNIVDVDPNQDYDAFCALSTEIIYMKKSTSVFCEIAKLGTIEILNMAVLHKIIDNLIKNVVDSIMVKEKQKAVEEMTEALILYFAILGKNAAAIKAENMETFIKISSYKSGETPGLSSRTKFKYMDLVGK
jgi:hypothetical protein